jgi:hypothetical protein
MSRGTEISTEAAWFGYADRPVPAHEQTDICHFDIKPDNRKHT